MDKNGATEALRSLIIKHDLPQTDMAVYGTKCPYCGKSDRIRHLEKPDRLSGFNDAQKRRVKSQYAQYWEIVIGSNENIEESLGVCKFCQNLLLLNRSAEATPLSI